MPVFTSKTSTDPGPFDALHPAPVEHATEPVNLAGEPGAPSVDEDGELENLFRFQEIPVSAEMRRELLGAKLPLASADQLADTQPPHKSGLIAPVPAPVGAALIDRHAPTEPALTVPQRLRDVEPAKVERPLLDGDSYSTTAPTLLSVRRRRLRNRRLVLAAMAAMVLAIMSGVAWRRYTRPPATLARDASSDRGTIPRIAGNRPASPPPAAGPDKPAGDAIREPTDSEPENATTDSQSAQPSMPAADATSSSPLSADPRSASREIPRASSPITSSPAPAVESQTVPRATSSVAPAAAAASDGRTQPKGKTFDPEELIF